MTSILRFTSCLIALLFSSSVFASGLISIDAFLDKQDQDDLVILEMQPPQYYQKAHIPGSVRTDYNQWRLTDANGLGKMLPDEATLGDLIRSLGIKNTSEVIIIPIGRGAGDMAAASRIYWSLYVAGLDQLSILEGGIIGYFDKTGQSAYESGENTPEPSDFVVKLRSEQIMNQESVAGFFDPSSGKQQSIVDARSPQEFTGAVSGGPKERPGSLPTAVNLPYDSLMNAAQDGLLPIEGLKAKFQTAGAPLEGPQVSYCHTGHRTALVWFVSHELLGNKQARLYDGSTLEWSSTKSRPLVIPNN